MASRPDEAVMVQLQGVAADLARALATERRRRRRVDAALKDHDPAPRLTARLAKSTRRTAELIDQIDALVATFRAANRHDRPGPDRESLAGPDARSRSTGRRAGVRVVGAVDIGSNSVHLLVAVVSGHRLEPLVDISEFLGLGDAVDDRQELGDELRRRLVETLSKYVARSLVLGAERTVLVGTHPLRAASDAAEALAEIEAATGESVTVLSQEEEAYVTLLGVTAGRPVRRNLILVDVGGGSSEVLWVPTTGAAVAVGLPLGSAGLTRRIVRHDPPTPSEMEAMQAEARRIMADAPEAAPDEIIIVGGSATNLLRVVPAAAIDRRVTSARVAQALQVLATETAVEAAERHGMREPRARTMPAGAAIVGAVLDRYGVERARVDEAGIREGLILAATHAGEGWRQDLAWLAHGWSR